MSTPKHEVVGEGRLVDVGAALLRVWRQQRDYNSAVKGIETLRHPESWSQVYFTGAIEELVEALKASGWKYHRLPQKVNRENLAVQLADVTKYVMSLWQEFNFTAADMLRYVEQKGEHLEAQLLAEWFPPYGRRAVISDLDGTVADYRAGFATWLQLQDKVATLATDLDNDMRWDEHERRKAQFEGEGGYAQLPAYDDAVALLRAEQDAGTYIQFITARPADQYANIVQDTYDWLRGNVLWATRANGVLFGRDERLLQLLRLAQGRNQVVLLEDEPTLALRAAHMGFPVLLRDQPYNRAVEHRHIHRYTTFPNRVPWDALYGQLEAA